MKKILFLFSLFFVGFLTSCEVSSSTESICYVGKTIINENVKYSFQAIEKYIDTSDFVFDEPAEGYEFIILKLSIENISDKDIYINMFYENSYCDDIAIDPEMLLLNYSGDTIWGDVLKGKKREGYIAYELPIGWKKIEFTYKPNNGQKITFIGYNTDVNKNDHTTTKPNQTTTTTQKPITTTTKSNQNNEFICYVGKSIVSENIKYSFQAIEKYIDTSDFVLDEPVEGYEFIILKLSIENNSDKDIYINMFYENSYCDDIAIDPEMLLLNYSGDTIWGDILEGKKREGYIAYELPIGWEKIEFTYKPNNGQKITFIGYNNDIITK